MQVEEVLRRHPGVSEVAAGGVSDPEWGARLVAYVVVSPEARGREAGSLLAELRELVKEHLAPFAAPRELVLVAELPRTAIGKISRAELSSLEGPLLSPVEGAPSSRPGPSLDVRGHRFRGVEVFRPLQGKGSQ